MKEDSTNIESIEDGVQEGKRNKIKSEDNSSTKDDNKEQKEQYNENIEEQQVPEKICRICLEGDTPSNMIAPCKCKGGSKWVHRECLDLWRTNEKDRAFSQCTECLFKYHMQPTEKHQNDNESKAAKRRRIKFYMLVSRDVCFIHIIVQLVIIIFASLIYLFDLIKNDQSYTVCSDENDVQEEAVQNDEDTEECKTIGQILGMYYFLGVLFLLVILGVSGSCLWCINGFSVSRSTPSFNNSRGLLSYQTTTERASVFRSHRQRNMPQYRQQTTRTHPCEHCGESCFHYGCCWPCLLCSESHLSNGGCSWGDCGHGDCCTGCFGGGCEEGNCAMLCCLCLLIGAFVMAVVGFVLGIIIMIISCQKIIQRHVYLLHKKQLVQEFEVMDLSGYNDIEIETMTDRNENMTLNAAAPEELQTTIKDNKKATQSEKVPTPTTRCNDALSASDVVYLQGLGLIDK